MSGRSTLTVAELTTQAMLLGDGWFYDEGDHTFNLPTRPRRIELDADTLEPLDPEENHRYMQVKRGEIGASDYVPIPRDD